MRACRLCHDGSRKKFWLRKTSGSPRSPLMFLSEEKVWLSLRRGVAIRAVLPEPHERVFVALRPLRPVRLPIVPSEPAPEPAVVGGAAVAHHDGGALLVGAQIDRIDARAAGRGRPVHLLDDDGAVRDRLCVARRVSSLVRPIDLEPRVHVGRVPDQRRRVRAEIVSRPMAARIGADPRSGVADALVDLPPALLVAMAEVAQSSRRAWPGTRSSGSALGLRTIGNSASHSARSVGSCGLGCSSAQVVVAEVCPHVEQNCAAREHCDRAPGAHSFPLAGTISTLNE